MERNELNITGYMEDPDTPMVSEKQCKIDIYAGLLGCGKTTLIKKLLQTEYADKKVAIIENEVGKVNLDAGELPGGGITIEEITGGCVCCTIRGAFTAAVNKLIDQVHPDYIVIEPTGAADIKQLIESCRSLERAALRRVIMVVNAKRIEVILSVVGPFYIEQIRLASCIWFNFTEEMSREKISAAIEGCLKVNPNTLLITVPIDEVDSETFMEADLDWTQGKEMDEVVEELLSQSSGTHASASESEVRLEIRDLDDKSKPLPIRIRSGSNILTLQTKTFDLQRPLTPEAYNRLKETLKEQPPEVLWRVKGILPLTTGTCMHLDLTFGDMYEQKKTILKPVEGKMVLIGKPGRNLLAECEHTLYRTGTE